jgi:epoxyqueuosine reductase
MALASRIRALAEEAGCTAVGITTAEPFAGVADTLNGRLAEGLGGKLRFTYKDPDRATDIRRSFPWAERIVVVSWPYLPAAGSPGAMKGLTGRIARFATEDHYLGLRRALQGVVAALRREGWRAEPLYDDDRLVDRAAAVRAGVAWWGKSTMALDPRNGPWTLLGAVVTDADLPPTEPMVRDCGTCDACIPACPTGAIVAPGVLDAGRCIAHASQMAGVIPRQLRAAMGDRTYGCDECLEVCPPGGKRLRETQLGVGRVDLLELLAADDAALRARYGHFYLPRRSPRFLRRNALIALGNAVAIGATTEAEREEAVAALAGFLGHPDALYRVHAAWALGRIGGSDCVTLLDYQLRRERDRDVAEEIRLALANGGESSGDSTSTLVEASQKFHAERDSG